MKAPFSSLTALLCVLLPYQFSLKFVNEILCYSVFLFMKKLLKLDHFYGNWQRQILQSTNYSHY